MTIRHIFTISHPKNHQVFIFKKFTETLKSTGNILFENLQIPFFYFKELAPKKKFEIKCFYKKF